MRVLDVFRPRGATWSGQVLSSPRDSSGGPSKTHLLPGGGVPRVHRARSPVPPRLPRFATPRSVHQFAAVAAGAYPSRCPPNVWSPGAPAPPGPVLLACRQWDPLGLARRLPCLGVGAWRSAPILPWRVQCPVRVCAALAAGSGGLGTVPGVVSLPFPPSRPACPALRVAGRPVRVSRTLARWYAIPRGLCFPRARSGCFSGSPCVPFACVCARAPAASAPPPPLGCVVCAPRAVPALGAGRAVPRGPCPSACPAPVPCSVWRALGGAVRSRFPPTWLLLRGASEVRRYPSSDCPPTGRAVGVRYPRAVGAGVWVWGPNTVPLACMPCAGCVPRGWWGALPTGGWPATVVRGVCVSGAVPPPAARPLGRAAGVP